MADVERCPHCQAELETPIACQACGSLLEPAVEPTPFAVLDLPLGHAVDPREVRRRLLRFSRLVHPDFFGTQPAAVRALAERNSARLNAAHEILSDEVRRADWLVRQLDGPDEIAERTMPQAFLLEVLEWNEELAGVRLAPPGSPYEAQLLGLEARLRENRSAALAAIARLLDPLPERDAARLRDVRKHLNAVRYLDRALDEIEALRLAKAAVR